MTQDNGNKSGLNLKNAGMAPNGESYDDNCLQANTTMDIGGKLNKTNISLISAKSMSQLSNHNVRNHPEIQDIA